ncbi:MAG: hypothetical protein QXJ17_08655 [Nitrososphaeria archaeon]
MIKCPVCGENLSSASKSSAHHFSRKKEKLHLAFLYLLIRSGGKKALWKEACEAATIYFSTSPSMWSSLTSMNNGKSNSRLIDKRTLL